MDGLPQTDSLSASPRLTRSLAIVLTVITAAASIPALKKPIVDNFALLPVATVGRSKLWNVLTAGFIDVNIVSAITNLGILFTTGRWIEASWGPRAMLFYFIVTNLCAGVTTYIAMVILFVITRSDSFFFTPIGTLSGISAALLIAIKQLIPEHEIGFSSVTLKANYLPLIFISTVTAITFTGLLPPGVFIFTVTAFHAAWLYLRYFRPTSTHRGDQSDEFTYATLFPPPVRPPIQIAANILFIPFKPILMANQAELEAANETATNVSSTSAKSSAIDAERRRQRAMQILDERLQVISKEEPADEQEAV